MTWGHQRSDFGGNAEVATDPQVWPNGRGDCRRARLRSAIPGTIPAMNAPDLGQRTPRAGAAAGIDRWDGLVGALLLVVGIGAAWALANAIAPDVTMIGPDSATYVQNAIAAANGTWTEYNGDKRQLHALICGWIGNALDGDFLGATRVVSVVAIGTLPFFTYFTGRAAFGRSVGLAGAVVVLAQPELWACTVDTSNYALFNAMIAAFVAAAANAAARPGVVTWGAAGALAALCQATQEKAALVVCPLALVGVFALWPPTWSRRWRVLPPLAAAGLMTWTAGRAVEIPVRMQTLANLVVSVRGDVNRNVAYSWPALRTRARGSPSPLSPILIGPLRGGTLEALSAAVLTPPDADVWRLALLNAKPAPTWVLAPGTSIPPARVRWTQTLQKLSDSPGRFGVWRAILLGFGIVILALPRRARGSRMSAWMVASVLISALPTLNISYVRRYLEHVLPVVALLQVAGVQWVMDLVPLPFSVRNRAAETLTIVFALGWGYAVATDRHSSQLNGPRPIAEALGELRRQQAQDGFAAAMNEAAAWLSEHTAPSVVDCGSVSMRLVLRKPLAIRTVGPNGCPVALSESAVPGSLLIVSDRSEYTVGTNHQRAALAADQRWESVARFVPTGSPQDAIEVFRAK